MATSIELDIKSMELAVGDDILLEATVNADATDKSVTWETSDAEKATVNEQGLVTAVAQGEVTITATTKDGSNLKDTCVITVVESGPILFSANQNLQDYPELEQNTSSEAKITFYRDNTCSIDAFYLGTSFTVKFTTSYSISNGILTFSEEPSNFMVFIFQGQAKLNASVVGSTVLIEIKEVGGENDGRTLAEFYVDRVTAKKCKISVGKDVAVSGIQNKGVTVIEGNSTVDINSLIEILPANASNKKFTAQFVGDVAQDVATLSGTQIITGRTDGDICLKVTTRDGNHSIELNLKVELQAKEYDENYFESIDQVGTLEKKYAPYGEYAVKEIVKKNVTGKSEITAYKIWYPAKLESSNEKYPAVVCLNGSNCTYADCEPVYKHLASWGFIVIGNNQTQAISGKSGFDCVGVLKELEQDVNSPLYKKIDLTKIGLQGGSQGGSGAIHAATSDNESNVFVSLLTLSAASSGRLGEEWVYDMSGLSIPCFMLSGTGEWDNGIVTSLKSLQENFDACKGETYIARRKGYDHEQMAQAADSYVVAWFLYTLKGDSEAAKVFTGDNPELFNNANWQDVNGKDGK